MTATRKRLARRPRRPRGVILFVVLLVVLMLALAGMSFVATLSTENKAAHLRGRQLALEQVVASGAELVKQFAVSSPTAQEAAGSALDNPDLFQGVIVLADDEPTGTARFSVVAPRIEEGELAGIRFGLENESAKLNLAALARWDQQSPGVGRAALMRLPGMTESIADAILDWIDADTAPRQFGAEQEYYAGEKLPYAPRNGAPACVEELLLVRDVTRQLLFGGDENRNHRLEPGEQQRLTVDALAPTATGALPWTALVTVYSAERLTTADGRPRINLNDADLARLHGALLETLGQPLADFTVLLRQHGPHSGGQELATNESVPVDLTVPPRYALASPLDLVGAAVNLGQRGDQAGVPLVVSSPLSDEPARLAEDLPRLMDLTCVDAQTVAYGRINIDLAPREVLSAVPGVDDAAVERILAARGDSGGDPARRHPTWLLAEGIIDLPTMRSLAPYLTCGGDVYRAQIIAFGDRPGQNVRVELAVDATRSPPRLVYWKDLRLLGPAYTPQELGAGIEAQ